MKRSFIPELVLAIALVLPVVSHAQQADEKPKELELLKRYVGDWEAEVARTSAESESDNAKYQESIVSEMVLDGRFLQSIKNASSARAPEFTLKTLSLTTFDDHANCYVSWDFSSSGRIVNGTGSWDPELKVLHWDWHAEPVERSVEAKTRFPDENSIHSEFSGKNRDGKLRFEKEKRTRKKGKLPDFTRQLWSKIETPIKPIPEEVKKLQPLVGRWEAEYTQLPSDTFPRGGESKGTITGKWILDGRFFLGRSKVQNYETQWVIGYDTDQETYRYIRFDNRGEIEENVGEWNDDTRTFKWKVVNGKPGHTKRATVYIIGDETVQSRITSRDADGDLLLDLRIRAKRKK